MIRTAASIRHYVQGHPDQYLLGLTTADIRAAKASRRLAVCLDVEGVFALGEQLSLVEFLYQIGVRWMLMVYNRRNLAGRSGRWRGLFELDARGVDYDNRCFEGRRQV